ncbi:class I SAM-dependent methyltransferase [Pelagicoccus mobilis]|uniref:Class I SAM-dependent methyltransferase n=1 Tax=Pelagicoccus mobilis TaxID=415221 RepID=A0A934RXK7_9BACT|nr:class I SAM-dependent methyltransferase [Pelagicoccus mobilis]MBK1878411.1 class I SAM-dependent methyltransferase [Pelagicoccus mobilis]
MNFSDRSNYEKTWEGLAKDFDSAQHFVAGHNDNKEFQRSAQVTLEVLKETIGVSKEDTFLEIGCGIGRVGRALSPHVGQWNGADISSGMIAQAEKYLNDLDNVSLHKLQASSLEQFEDESFDAIYCTVVFMHLLEWDRYRYIKEAMRLLKPGGRVYFDNVDITTDHGWQVFTDGYNIPVSERPAHMSMVSSADELLTYGQKAGYQNTRIHRWGGAWVALVGTKS